MRTAFVTTLCHGDGYVPGVEALGRSLAQTQTSHERLVLVTPDVSQAARTRLTERGWSIREILPIASPVAETEQMFARFANTFTKLRVWELTDYDKLVYLDADTIVLQNVDDLFERPAFAAAPDFFLPDRFNSGVMVLRPAHETFERMMSLLFSRSSYDGGDQGFLNAFMADWYSWPVSHRLPAGYNMQHFIYQFLRGHPTVAEQIEHEAKIVHYSVQKPWLAKATLTGGAEAWWKMYFGGHPDEAASWKDKMHAAEDWSFDKLAKVLLG